MADDLYQAAVARIDEVMGVEVGTPESEELKLLVALVVHYEQPNHMPSPASPPDPIPATMPRERAILNVVASLAKRTDLPPLEVLELVTKMLPRGQRESTHWEECWRHHDHHACALDRIEELSK